MEKIDRSRIVVYSLYLRLKYVYCCIVPGSHYCLGVCACAQGFRAEWCQSESVSVVPASSASLKIDLSRHRERGNTPPPFTIFLSLFKIHKVPKTPPPPPQSHFPLRQVAARARHRLTHSHAGRGPMGGVGSRLAQRGIITLDGSRACRR